MKRISDQVYEKIDNSIYDSDQINWWQKDSPFNLIESVLNPVRINYFRRALSGTGILPPGKKALEVGCGGGIMCEEIARLGFETTGIDPSGKSLAIAREHAGSGNLSIRYVKGTGEQLPFRNESFDVVFCCDVLEHVRDFAQVISEISRVLKRGGYLLYDTMNRTWISNLVVIQIMQKWKYFSVLPSHLHVWKMFIRPSEMKEQLFLSGLQWIEHRGINTFNSNLSLLKYLHRRAAGTLSCVEFSKKCRLREGGFLQVAYMGYAVKI